MTKTINTPEPTENSPLSRMPTESISPSLQAESQMTKRLRRGTKILVLDEDAKKFVPYIVGIFNKLAICAYPENGEHERVLLYPFPFFFYPEGGKQPIEHYRIMDAHYTKSNEQKNPNT